MLTYILFFLVFCICVLICVKYNNKKHIEKFSATNRITMDDVLDYSCSVNAPAGYNNYVGPWPNDPYNRFGYDPNNGKCSRYACPTERCYVMEKDTLNMMNPYAYRYVLDPNERQNWVSNVDDEGNITSGSCVTKHNAESNVYCEPDLYNTCPYLNLRTYEFDSNENVWKNRTVNFFTNSNGNCELRDVNHPYDLVKVHNNENSELIYGDSSTTKIYYTERGGSCRLEYEGGVYYNADDVPVVDFDGGIFDDYNPRTNKFTCKNGSSKEYGYSNAPNQIPGFSCGWMDDTVCERCPQIKSTPCYVFDSNSREYSKRNFLQANYATGIDQSLTPCGTYLVNSNYNDIFDALPTSHGELLYTMSYEDLKEDSVIHQNTSTPFVITETQYYDCNNCIQGIDPNQCSADGQSELEILGDNLPAAVFTEWELSAFYSPKPVVLRPEKYRFMTVNATRRWDSNGSNCEYCYVDQQDNIIESTCQDTQFVQSEPSCPKGLEYVPKMPFDHAYCGFCQENEYYDINDSNCKPFTGCLENQYFDPFETISNTFKIYNFETKQDITENNGFVSKDNYANYNFVYLQDNSNTQCRTCPANTFINNSHFVNNQNVKYDCETCPHTDTFRKIYTVENNQCSFCVKEGQEYSGDTPKYVKYDANNNNRRSCMRCHALSNPQYSGQNVVSITQGTATNSPGTCYRECLVGERDGGVRIANSTNKAYIPGSGADAGEYPLCDILCINNYYMSNNSCFACPVGEYSTIQTSTTCEKCPAGSYNDTPGESCWSCPDGGSSDEGSSNINQCYKSCTGSTPCNVYFNNGYHLSSCPTIECHLGYNVNSLGNGGHLITQVTGERNPSLVTDSCSGDSIDTRDESCPSSTHLETFENPSTVVESFITVETPKYCCPSDMRLNAENNSCVCEDVSYYTDLYGATYTQHVASYAYIESPGQSPGQCRPNSCVGNNTTLVNGLCEMSCLNNQYIDVASSTCCNCPIPEDSHASAMTANGGEGVESCEIASCSNGYTYVENPTTRGPPMCEAITAPCSGLYEHHTHPWESTTYSIVPINPSSASVHRMSNEDIPTYHNMLLDYHIPVLTPTECASYQTNSNSVDPTAGMCYDGGKVFIPGKSLIMCCSNDGETVKETTLNTGNYALCCSNNTETVGTVDGGVTYLGCCPLSYALYTYTDTTSGTKESICCPASTPVKEYYAENGKCEFNCIDGQKNGEECDTLTQCPAAYKVYKSVDEEEPSLFSGGYYLYENVPQDPIVEGSSATCSNSDTHDGMSLDDLSNHGRRCRYDGCQDEFLCCIDREATIHEKTEPSPQSGSGSDGVTVTVNVTVGSGGQQSSDECPNPPPQYVCKKQCPRVTILNLTSVPNFEALPNEFIIPHIDSNVAPVEYNSVLSSYECPSPYFDYECPEGYDDRIDEPTRSKCRLQGTKTCYSNIVNRYDEDNANANWYVVVRSNVETSYSCEEYFERHHGQSNWFDQLDTCPRGATDGYTQDNMDQIACCKSNDTDDDNTYYHFVGHKCMNISDESCGEFAHVNPDDTGACQCAESWCNISDLATYPDVTVFEKYRPVYNDTPTHGCRHEYGDAQYITNINTVCISENSNRYCCPGLGKKPYKIAEGIYTCSNVWTSNIKPQGLNGYDAGAVVYHHIDFDLAKELESSPS